jgi:spermidine synthase
MDTQLLLGHLPMLARPGARRALVVGLASGVSAGAVAVHGPESLEVVEISPEVAAAEPLFRPWNGDPTRRPGVRLLLEDGRAHVEHAGGAWDVVVSEPTNPWIAGVSDLFTAEFFRACRARLAPGGVLGVWLQAYGLAREDFRLVVRTARSVFPATTVWETSPGSDYLILASADDGADPAAAIAARPWPGGEAAAGLAAAGVRSREDALAMLFLGREGAAAFAAGGGSGEIHTDDRLQLEFRLPRTELASTGEDLADRGFLESVRAPGDLEALPGVDPARLRAAVAARRGAAAALAAGRDGVDPATGDMPMIAVLRDPARFEALLPGVPGPLRGGLRGKARGGFPPALLPEEAEALLRARTAAALEEALAAGCREVWLRLALGRERVLGGKAALAEGDLDLAGADFRRAAEVLPGSATPRFLLSRVALLRGDAAEALAEAGRALAIHPGSEPARAARALALHALGRTAEAEREVEGLRALRPDSVRALAALARIRLDGGRREEALALAEEGLALEPQDADLLAVREATGRGR